MKALKKTYQIINEEGNPQDIIETNFLESWLNTDKYMGGEWTLEDIELVGQDLEDFLDKWVRPTRNQLLKDSDALWIEKSSKGEDLTALNAYKQALRDFPENLDLSEIEYVDEIEFPTLGA